MPKGGSLGCSNATPAQITTLDAFRNRTENRRVPYNSDGLVHIGRCNEQGRERCDTRGKNYAHPPFRLPNFSDIAHDIPQRRSNCRDAEVDRRCARSFDTLWLTWPNVYSSTVDLQKNILYIRDRGGREHLLLKVARSGIFHHPILHMDTSGSPLKRPSERGMGAYTKRSVYTRPLHHDSSYHLLHVDCGLYLT